MFNPDVWGTVSDWVIAATAITATAYGGYQIKLLIETRRDAIDEQRTNLKVQQGLQLMEIDKQYEGVLQPSRRALAALRQQIEGEVAETDPAQRRERIAALLSEHLDSLRGRSATGGSRNSARVRATAAKNYFELMQLPNYIETMGVLVEEKLVDERALMRLYDGAIIAVIGPLLPHIRWRRSLGNPSYLHFAEKLYEMSVAHMRQATP